jgi:3-hydroxybutyryl-CoA dehydratase
MKNQAQQISIGVEFRTPPRPMTRERMRWYVDAQPTIAADDGRIHTQPPTIHDDDDYAESQGLPGIIADGMISTNWIQGLLCDVFGSVIASQSRLRTKYIAPIYEDQIVIAVVRVSSVTASQTGGFLYELDVWCEDDTGKKLTVGNSSVDTSPQSKGVKNSHASA